MDIDWTTPFVFAFELAMWIIGSILVVALVLFAVLVFYSLVRAFFIAVRNVRGSMNDKKNKTTPDLKAVD